VTSRIHMSGRLRAATIALAMTAAFCFVSAAHADQTITTAGPLTQIGVGADLHCAVNYFGDDNGEFFDGTACGTYLDVGGPTSDGGTVYGAPDQPAASAVGSTAFTQDSQSTISGDGSAANPYTVSTQVNAGVTGLSLTQSDTYVAGDDDYKSTVRISNSASQAQTVVLYHAADCYLGNDDHGYGYRDNASGGIFCTKNAENTPAGRVEGFVPVDGASDYLETFYNTMWQALSTGQPLPDTCDCSTFEDNSMAISWTVTVPPAGAVTRSWSTDFSPVGNIRVSSYVALGDSVAAGEGINYDATWNGSTWTIGDQNPAWDTSSGQPNPDCHQSADGYPHVLAGLLSATLLDLGCTGAGTDDGVLTPETDLAAGEILSPPQLGVSGEGTADSAYDNAAPDIVSLTVGADDIDFKDRVQDCYTPVQHACGSANDRSSFLTALTDFKPGLTGVLNQIKLRGVADGKLPLVALTEYYSPFPNTYPTHSSCIDISPDAGLGYTLTDAEMQYLQWGLLNLNATIDDVAATFPNVVIVPAPVSFAQHRWCSSDPWVYGPSIDHPSLTSPTGNGNPAPFHPTPEGQNAIAQNIADFLADERHVDTGSNVPVSFGDISVLLGNVQTAGTAFFNALGALGQSAQAQAAPEGSHRVLTRAAVRAATATADDSADSAAIPPTSTVAPVQIYSAGTSAQYTDGLTITLPSLGASDLYEVVGGAWQLIPTTTDGTNLTATLDTLGALALGNPAPAVTASFSDSGNNGQAPATVGFDASSSNVAPGSITDYAWDFGDGSTGAGVNASHVYTAAGTYTVTLTATSDAGPTDIATQTVTVTDAPPVAVVTYPASVTDGAPASGFDASGSHAADGPIADTYWDFGDGSALVDAPTATHMFNGAGAYTVTTTVLDDEGSADAVSKVIAVLGALGAIAPTVTIPAPTPVAGASTSTPSSPSQPPARPRRAKLSFGKHVAYEAGRLALTLSCAKTGATCQGKLKLVVKAGRRMVTVATGRFHLKAGKRVILFLRDRGERTVVKQAAAITVAGAKTHAATVTLTLALDNRRKR
jgi:PKD repeat protein